MVDVIRFHGSPKTCTFVVQGISLALANAIRRNCRAQVPTMAIEWACIKNNTSSWCNEVIAQRLGLIPLNSQDIINYNYEADCPCAGAHCAQCTSVLTLNVASASAPMDVMTQLLETETMLEVASSTVYPIVNMPFLTLQGHETILLRALATKGVGKTHSKWDPCCEVLMMEVTDDTFSFRVESCGQHTALKIVVLALQALEHSFQKYLIGPVQQLG